MTTLLDSLKHTSRLFLPLILLVELEAKLIYVRYARVAAAAGVFFGGGEKIYFYKVAPDWPKIQHLLSDWLK